MDHVLFVREKNSRVEFVNQFAILAQDYMRAVEHHESIVVDFQRNNHIDSTCSKELFGRLLVDEKIHNVLCRNINSHPDVIKAIFEGVLQSFRYAYPKGIHFHGRHIIEPQVELYDPSGDKVYSVVRLSDDDYEAIRK